MGSARDPVVASTGCPAWTCRVSNWSFLAVIMASFRIHECQQKKARKIRTSYYHLLYTFWYRESAHGPAIGHRHAHKALHISTFPPSGCKTYAWITMEHDRYESDYSGKYNIMSIDVVYISKKFIKIAENCFRIPFFDTAAGLFFSCEGKRKAKATPLSQPALHLQAASMFFQKLFTEHKA